MGQNVTQTGHMSTLVEQVAANARAELAIRKKTAADLAKILHIGYRAALRRFNGEQEFSLTELATVSFALGIPVSVLMVDRTADKAVA